MFKEQVLWVAFSPKLALVLILQSLKCKAYRWQKLNKTFFRCCSLGSDLHILALLKIRTIFNQSYIGVHKYHFCLSMLLSDLKGERSGLDHQVTQRVEPSQVKICIHTQIVIPFFYLFLFCRYAFIHRSSFQATVFRQFKSTNSYYAVKKTKNNSKTFYRISF